MREKIPDWIPDWRDEKQYPNPDELNLQGWAWEFLRRNSDYWKDWKTVALNEGMFVFNQNLEDLRCEKEWRPGDIKREPIQVAFGKKWGQSTFIKDPAEGFNDGLPSFFITYISPKVMNYYEVGGKAMPSTGKPERRSEMGLIFDLELPLGLQLEHARVELDRQRNLLVQHGKINPTSTRPKIHKYPEYLRCYDASLYGARTDDIADVLYFGPGNYPDYAGRKAVTNALVAVRTLIGGTYRKLPAMTPVPRAFGLSK